MENFPSKNFEGIGIKEKLKSVLKYIHIKLVNEGIGVTDDCRIDMDAYAHFYPKPGKDDNEKVENRYKRYMSDYQEVDFDNKKNHPNKTAEQIKGEQFEKENSQLEIFTLAIFNKFLGDDFIAVRASEYDDFRNSADIVILKKSTNELVCALDDVRGADYKVSNKKVKMEKKYKNSEGGQLQYALEAIKENGRIRVAHCKPRRNLPIFYLPLDDKDLKDKGNPCLKNGLRILNPNLAERSSEEKKYFDKFIRAIYEQIQFYGPKVKGDLKTNMDNFSKSLDEIIKKHDISFVEPKEE